MFSRGEKVLQKHKLVPEWVLTDIPKHDYPRRDRSYSGGDRGTLPISVLKIAVSSAVAGGHWRSRWSEVLFLI